MPPELHLYDFDGTLFRSPEKPLWWPGGESWWVDQRSLNAPCVPDNPTPDWWINSTVAEAKRSISDQEVYAVLATGRADHSYRWRVPELLKQKGLRFDEVHLNPGGNTQAWKKNLLVKILRSYPFIRKVQIWEDQSSNLNAYLQFLTRAGYAVEGHLVKAKNKKPLCELDTPGLTEPGDPEKVVFTEVALVDPDKLLAWWLREVRLPLLPKLFSHHMTLQFQPEPSAIGDLPLGRRVPLEVVGWTADEKAQAVVVKPSGVRSENPTPHITIATDGTSPAYSNDLLASGYTRVRGPTLLGTVGFFDGKEHRFQIKRARRLAQRWVRRLASSYDPESWYYDLEPGTPLQTVIDRWQKRRPGVDQRGNPLPRQKAYNRSMPGFYSVQELWPLREYTWTRDKARPGFARVQGKSVELSGPEKWDALLEDMKTRGWDPGDPLQVDIGSDGGVKVGEGNHRLAIARKLGMTKVPVEFRFLTGRVRKERPHQEPIEVAPKAVKKVIEERPKPRKPLSPEEKKQVDDLLDLLFTRN